MKRLIIYPSILIMLFSFTINSKAQPGQWVRKDSIKGPGKFGCISFNSGGYGYLGLGYDDNDYKRSIYRYDPFADDWDKMESLGGVTGSGLGRSMAIAFVIKDKAYVGLGQGSSPFMGDLWEYDIATDTWLYIQGVGISSRRGAIAFSIDTVAYVGLGYESTGLKQDLWKYDPSNNTWTQMANYGGTPRQKAVAVAMHQKGYVGLGDDGILRDDFWKYDPTTNSWAPVPSFPGGARSGACAFVVGADMFVGTGQNYTSYKKDFWQFNLWQNQWTQIQDFGDTLASPRAYASAFSIGGVGYVGAGYDGEAKDDFYAFEAPVGIKEHSTTSVISTVYPIPMQTKAIITFNSDENLTDYKLTIYDLKGQLLNDKIVVEDIVNIGGEVKIYLNNISLSTGQYLYQITHNLTHLSSGKILIVK